MCSRWSARRDEVRLISTMSSHRPSRFLEQVVGLDVGVDEAVPEWGRERVVGALERNGIGEEPLAGVGRQHQQLPRCQGRGRRAAEPAAGTRAAVEIGRRDGAAPHSPGKIPGAGNTR